MGLFNQRNPFRTTTIARLRAAEAERLQREYDAFLEELAAAARFDPDNRHESWPEWAGEYPPE